MISAICISVASCVIAAWMIYTILSLAPWLPTRKSDIARIGTLSGLKSGETFYDLGSGDARVILLLARLYPDARFVGVEMSFVLHGIACARVFFSGVTNVRLIRGNIYTQSYGDADVLYVFGVRRSINSPRFLGVVAQLRAHSRIVLYNFTLKRWDGITVRDAPEGQTPLTIYTVPE